MRALEKLGLCVIKKSGYTTFVVLKYLVLFIRHLVCKLILARLIVLATFQYFQVLALIFGKMLRINNLASVLIKICHKHHLFSAIEG